MRYAIRGPTDGMFRKHDAAAHDGVERSEDLTHEFTFQTVEEALREVALIVRESNIAVTANYPRYQLVRVEKKGYEVTEVLE